MKVGGTSLPATYTYVAGAHGGNSTTGLIQSISQTGGNFTYTYDDNGNITQVVQDGVTTSYTYDALGQLIQVDDGQENATWVYTYDHGGNILTKKKYALGTTSGTLLESKTFTYGNSGWKDLLTAVNGTSISYDTIGNPTYDGTWSYTWEKGRQLARMYKSGETVSFKYNADGLRVQKVATSTGTTNYTLHGKNIVHMTQGSNSLHFFYDASNKPAIVEYNGVKYAYVHNLQGDIVAILDSNDTKVVEYKYDAWGKPISKTGSMADTLGTVQPFRYRAYVYDEETGLYYVRNRYYAPCRSRFLTADDSLVLTESGPNLHEKNLYAYCDNNPIVRDDQGGDIWGWLVGATVGAVAGVVGQIVSDVITSVVNQEITISSWQTYAGAAVGGAAGGVVLATTGNVNAANAVSGAVTTGAGMVLDKVTGNADYSWGEIAVNTLVDGAVGLGCGKAPGVKGITSGRNSWSAVFRSGLKKLWKGSAVNMSKKVFRKGILSSIVGGYAMDIYYGIKQHAYERTRDLLVSED